MKNWIDIFCSEQYFEFAVQGLCEIAQKSAADSYANLTRAGSKNNHLLLGEALSHEFEGKVLNPFGVEIDLPFWVFKRLKKLHLLERDRPTGIGSRYWTNLKSITDRMS